MFNLATQAGARAMQREGTIGNFVHGAETAFIVLDPQAMPLLARRTGRIHRPGELLFAIAMLDADRCIAATYAARWATSATGVAEIVPSPSQWFWGLWRTGKVMRNVVPWPNGFCRISKPVLMEWTASFKRHPIDISQARDTMGYIRCISQGGPYGTRCCFSE